MALFNRKKADPKVLPEIEKYYDAEKRERIGLAWLLAVVSIACVALLLIGAFFGGRWVFRKVSHTDKKTGVSTTATSGSEITKPKTTPSPSAQTPSTPSSGSDTKPKANPTPATPQPTTPSPNSAPSTTPTTNPSALANTGPVDTVAIFMISAIGFAGLHNFLSRRALTK